MTDKYQVLRDGMPELQREAARKGGYNPRAQLIIDLLAERDALQAENERLRKALVEQSDHEAWLASLPPEDRMIEEIRSMATKAYLRHYTSIKGQQVSAADTMESHLIWATKRWVEINEPAPATSPTEQQPDVSALVEALERIASWPDGGNQAGQPHIKMFAAKTLAAYRQGDEE